MSLARRGPGWGAVLLLAALLFLQADGITSAIDGETCYSRQHRDAIVNVHVALNGNGATMDARVEAAERDCVLACCSEEVKPGIKCNMVVYKPSSKDGAENCYLFHCETEHDCPLMVANPGINTYDIFKGLTHPAVKGNPPTKQPTTTQSTSATVSPKATIATVTQPPLATTTTQPPTMTSTTPPTTTTTTTTLPMTTTTEVTTKTTNALATRESAVVLVTMPVVTMPSMPVATIVTTATTKTQVSSTTTAVTSTTLSPTLPPKPPQPHQVPAKSSRPLKRPEAHAGRPNAKTVEISTKTIPTTTATQKPTTTTAPTTTSTTTSTTTTITTATTTTPSTMPSTTTTTTTTTTATAERTTVVVVGTENDLKNKALGPDTLKPSTAGSGPGKAPRSQSVWKNSLVVVVVVTLIFLTLLLAIVGRKAVESFDRRHYTRLELNDLHYEI
ncbi:MANSC domain-containing protein 1 [Electrophorus electricus]|uniref:MANSC domain-containing protein 1 n=1 Tax=Electrophorus electricus TaxID=8005 RepID=UPI0015D09C3D|nr:MANSC domain-containing protein 1 [Electrophorus electricus]